MIACLQGPGNQTSQIISSVNTSTYVMSRLHCSCATAGCMANA